MCQVRIRGETRYAGLDGLRALVLDWMGPWVTYRIETRRRSTSESGSSSSTTTADAVEEARRRSGADSVLSGLSAMGSRPPRHVQDSRGSPQSCGAVGARRSQRLLKLRDTAPTTLRSPAVAPALTCRGGGALPLEDHDGDLSVCHAPVLLESGVLLEDAGPQPPLLFSRCTPGSNHAVLPAEVDFSLGIGLKVEPPGGGRSRPAYDGTTTRSSPSGMQAMTVDRAAPDYAPSW